LSIASAIICPICILVGAAGTDLGDLPGAVHLLAHAPQLIDDRINGELDAALDLRGVGSAGDVAQAFGEDGLGVHGRGGRSVAGHAGGFGGDLLDHLRAHVLVGVFQLDFLGDGHAVLGDGGGPEGFFEHDVSPGRPERDLDRARQFAHAAQDRLPGFLIKCDSFGCHVSDLRVPVSLVCVCFTYHASRFTRRPRRVMRDT
jgi:hypothetical protein